MEPICKCYQPNHSDYLTDFCRRERGALPTLVVQSAGYCRDDVELIEPLPPTTIPTSTDPVAESAKGGKGGFDFGGLLSGFGQGASSIFGGGQSRPQPTGAPQIIIENPENSNQSQSRGWIPFAIIGGVALLGVIGYVVIKNSKK